MSLKDSKITEKEKVTAHMVSNWFYFSITNFIFAIISLIAFPYDSSSNGKVFPYTFFILILINFIVFLIISLSLSITIVCIKWTSKKAQSNKVLWFFLGIILFSLASYLFVKLYVIENNKSKNSILENT